jgi:hypothetical protein
MNLITTYSIIKSIGLFCCGLLAFTTTAAGFSPILQPAALKCEYRINPHGIDKPKPRLSWILKSD